MPVEVGKPVEGGKPVKELHLNAYAKVNLTLNVVGARSDGYHEIESVMHTIALHDSITLREAGTGVEVLVTNSEVPNDHRNLVVRAAQLLRDAFAVKREDVRDVGRLLRNVFEDLITAAHPLVGDVKKRILRGEAYGAALSGTGPTVFGLMANEAAARKVAEELQALPEVDVQVTRTFAEER